MATPTAKTALPPTPSRDDAAHHTVIVTAAAPAGSTVLGIPVPATGPVPAALGIDRARLEAAGFTAAVGSTLVLPSTTGPVLVAVGIGDPAALDAAALRDAAAAFARAAATHERLATTLADARGVASEAAGQAVVEGVFLARYRYNALRREARGKHVRDLALVVPSGRARDVRRGAERGRVYAAAMNLTRDLANTPHSHLSASRLANLAVALSKQHGFGVEVFDKDALMKLGIGGLLGINQGSVEPPRMIKLTYGPKRGASGRLALVGKGIMYDAGGIALKPADRVHAQMKNDMSGAAAILAAFTSFAELGCKASVTGYLMCTDNMPSGSALALGDVITHRGGTTVEVFDTDAEGRLVLADGLVLAREAGHDAIVDIATLTGSAKRALGSDMAAVLGTNQALVNQVKAAAVATDEPVWQLPLYRPYLRMLESGVADMMNCAAVGTPDAILASLFLAHFAGDVPWAHLDICGPAQNEGDRTWHPDGCSGFGTRLLLELALGFRPPAGRAARRVRARR